MWPMADEVLWTDGSWELRRETDPAGLVLLAPGTSLGRASRAADALRGLRSDDLVAVTGVVQQGERHGLRLEDPGGETLASHLTRSALSATEAVDVVVRVGRALHVMHRYGIVHRMVCPGLVLLATSGAKLCPAEAAKPERSVDLTRQGFYMPVRHAYIAPEVLLGEATAASDAWALGVLLYTMLVGREPIQENDPIKFELALQSGLPALPEALPEDLRDTFAGLTKTSPSERWSVAKALAWLGVTGPAEPPSHEPLPPEASRITLGIDATILTMHLPCLVGRDDPTTRSTPDLDLTPFDPELTVSRRHARIYEEAGRLFVEDLGSRNRTQVNGRPVTIQTFTHGDVLTFGAVSMRVTS